MHTSSMHAPSTRENAFRVVALTLSLLFATLAFAALDDITTGVEADFPQEWIVGLAADGFPGGSAWMLERRLHRETIGRRRGPEEPRP